MNRLIIFLVDGEIYERFCTKKKNFITFTNKEDRVLFIEKITSFDKFNLFLNRYEKSFLLQPNETINIFYNQKGVINVSKFKN